MGQHNLQFKGITPPLFTSIILQINIRHIKQGFLCVEITLRQVRFKLIQSFLSHQMNKQALCFKSHIYVQHFKNISFNQTS